MSFLNQVGGRNEELGLDLSNMTVRQNWVSIVCGFPVAFLCFHGQCRPEIGCPVNCCETTVTLNGLERVSQSP